jgi:putative ABC transport system permease protein
MMNLFYYIGLRHLQLKPLRAILTTLGVALGISLYTGIAIINTSTQNSMRESIEAVSGKAKISVTAGPVGFAEEKLETVKNTTGVQHSVPMIEERAFFEGATDTNDGLYIMGVDLLQESAVRTYKTTDQKIIDDPLVFLNQPDSIILTQKLADARKLGIDSKIRLATTTGAKTFTVRGILEPEGAAKAFGGSLAIMDIDGARVSFGKENKIDRIDVVPAANFTTEQVRLELQKNLGPAFTVETPEAQSEQMEKMLASYQMILTFFSTIALLVGLFLIVNSISIAVAERKKEIGTLRALGATRTSMVKLFVSEVIGIGIIGSLLGCALGRILATLMVKQLSDSLAGQFQTQVEVTRLIFTSEQFWISMLLGTVASIGAAFFPALKAARVHPLESMKSHAESRSTADETQAKRLVVVGLLLLLFTTASNIFHFRDYWILLDPITKGCSVVGTALFGPYVVLLLLRLIRKLKIGNSKPIFRLSRDNLLKSPRRTSSNVMALLVGLFMVMLVSVIRSSFHETLMSWIDRAFTADMLIASNGRMITADVQPIQETIAPEILKIPGIREVGPGNGIATRIVRIEYEGKKMTIKAMDQSADWIQYKNIPVRTGDRQQIARQLYESKDALLLASEGFLIKQNKKIGDTIQLNTPSGSIPFKIVGDVVDFASAEGVFYMNRAVYKKYWNDPLVTTFVVNLAPGHTLETVRSEISKQLAKKYNLVVISNAEFRVQMKMAVERTFAYTRAIEWIALIVGLLGLLNTMMISVMERTREIGMLRAIGSTQGQISRMILIEALLQGGLGSMVAIASGAYIGYLFITFNLTASLGWVIDYYLVPISVITTLITGIAVAMIAGIFPARRAARLPISEALDYE